MNNLAQQFRSKGYFVLKGMLSPAEVSCYRKLLQEVSGKDDRDTSETWRYAEGVSKDERFWDLIFHPKLIAGIKEGLGPTAKYTRHSDLHVHSAVSGWHRDSANRTFGEGPDWDESREEYAVARVAIYLQTFEESKSALGVIPGSHKFEKKLSPLEEKIWKRLEKLVCKQEPETLAPAPGRLWIRTDPKRASVFHPPAQPEWVRTEPGDCIVFNQRLFHAATPNQGPRYAMFLSYGLNNEHSRHHIDFFVHQRKELGYGPLIPELKKRLQEADLYMEE